MIPKGPKILQLDLNERLSPPDQRVARALCYQAGRANRYVRDEECHEIKKLVAKARAISPEEIVFFNGSWHGLMTVFSFLFHEADEVVIPVPTFPFYLDFIKHRQFKVKKISGQPGDLTAEKVIRSFGPKTRGLYLVNPTNPFGEIIAPQEIKRILSLTAKKKIFVVLDEAYGELAGIDNAKLIKRYSNLIIAKSGSKAYGLGGARAGYLIMNKRLAKILESCRGPSYILSAPALASLSAFYQEKNSFVHYVEEIVKIREELKRLLNRKNLRYYDSQANFVTFSVKNSSKFVNLLARKNIFIKNLTNYPDGGLVTKNLVRITVPLKKDWPRLKKVLDRALAE